MMEGNALEIIAHVCLNWSRNRCRQVGILKHRGQQKSKVQ
jgi:hypothetical protein